ncbi:serine hydrolase domain-containing protein [Spiroplasma endosymbiont of Cantharis lateralis]|uniref:serine hydrolase domain-containing protein n=1 Tax=Spiroplasma endosymbiont of Cantharis lateralis TaxID=3066277 RepID=UPI00313C29BD
MNNFENTKKKLIELVEKKYFTGAVLKINKEKQNIFSFSYGINDVDTKSEMNENLIFRGYSLTKTVTVAAFLTLIDEKVINLNDPLHKFFPEFKNMKVLNSQNNNEIVDAKNEILIKHLLTMTSGLAYFGNKTITQKQTTLLLSEFAKPIDGKFMDYSTFINKLSKIPLEFEPGTNWRYGLSLDVIAAVIEKATSMSYRDFVKQRIFDRLEMLDSDFYLKDRKREAKVYNWSLLEDEPILEKVENFNFFIQEIDNVPNMPMGGAGLFTTVGDYLKFLDFLIDGKDINGKQIISEKILKEMTTDRLKKLRSNFRWTLNEDYSYGYGVRVRIENKNFPLTEIGEFGWDGLLGSTGLVDPLNKFSVCLMLSSKPGHNKLIESEFFEKLYQDLKSI